MSSASVSQTSAQGPSASAQRLKFIRKLHLYFGLFIAPALIFFGFTGAVQTLSLHESAGTSYTPPAWLARMAQLHKNQNITLRPHRPGPPAAAHSPAGTPAAPHADRSSAAPQKTQETETLAGKEARHLPEKIFFLVVALGLLSSTCSGIYMAYRYERNKLLVTALLVAGAALPLLLLLF